MNIVLITVSIITLNIYLEIRDTFRVMPNIVAANVNTVVVKHDEGISNIPSWGSLDIFSEIGCYNCLF